MGDTIISANAQKGIRFMIVAMVCFAVQDGLSRHLAENYNVITTVAIRYAFFIVFVLFYGHFVIGSVKKMASTKNVPLQVIRGLILALMSSLAIMSSVRNGLVNFHSIFASYPLIILALSAPLLSEHVSWRQWITVTVGFIGVIFILRPDTSLVNSGSILAISAAVLMAVYGILTRFASKTDDAYTSLFWAATVGGAAMLFLLLFHLEPPRGSDWLWMGTLCVVGAFGHFLLIRALSTVEAATIQPFAYLQLLFASSIGIFFFKDEFNFIIFIGCALIVGAGLVSFRITSKVSKN